MLCTEPFFNYTTPYFELLKITLNGDAQICKVRAIDVGEGEKIGFCSKRSFEHGIWYTAIPYEKGIIYDSADQLKLPPQQRSFEWMYEAASQHANMEGYWMDNARPKNSNIYGPVRPIMREIFGDISSLGWHFYYVSL